MPLLIGALPLLGHQHLGHHHHGHTHGDALWLEVLMVGIAAVIGYTTLGKTYQRHRRPLPLLLFTLGLVMLISGHTVIPQEISTGTTVMGALLLAGAQLFNRRCHPATACCQGHQA
jgi:hypothetical protein